MNSEASSESKDANYSAINAADEGSQDAGANEWAIVGSTVDSSSSSINGSAINNSTVNQFHVQTTYHVYLNHSMDFWGEQKDSGNVVPTVT